MSSHHIVREDQEPALIIDDFQAVGPDLLGELLEWSPTVVTNTESFRMALQAGIKVDFVLADEPVDIPQDHVKVVPLNGDFLLRALDYLIGEGYGAASLLSSRADPSILLQVAGKMSAALLGNGQRVFAVGSGFSKWISKGETVYFYGDTEIKDVHGLAPVEANRYVVESDGLCTVYFKGAYGLIGEQL